MSDIFLNTLADMKAGESIVYHAASPQSRDKLLALISMIKYSVDVQEQGARHFKITITRKAYN